MKNKDYSLKKDGSFAIKDYSLKHPFSDFLPGISGAWGVPLWVFYVNRGQAVAGFGIKDKNHSISEFFPANKAYSFTPDFGFRTFVKIDKKRYYEPFRASSCSKKKEEMLIKSDSLTIRESSPETGLDFQVKYFTLPNASAGALVRKVSIKNNSGKKVSLEALDGLSRIIPFGSINPFLKDMSRTLEAWMRSQVEAGTAFFNLIVDPRDVSRTEYISGANFNCSFWEEGGRKVPSYFIVDPAVVFGQDTSYSFAGNFSKKDFKVPVKQITCGKTPCSFSYFKWDLAKGCEKTFYSVFGSVFERARAGELSRVLSAGFLEEKEAENKAIVEEVKDNAFCLSGFPEFNQYIRTTYLDNVLRGGLAWRPEVKDSRCKPYHIYSRKHGDLERDYNNFQLLPSCFSEGEANYRDINQNRRMDLFFEPSLKSANIVYFLNLIKIDGYNPLIMKGEKLYFDDKDKAAALLEEFGLSGQKLLNLMAKGFYLGEFFEALRPKRSFDREKLAEAVLAGARRRPQASHGEGYWIDHWHYNLELIESFLYFYPDKAQDLFLSDEFTFWDDEHRVKERAGRYVLRGEKVYQGESVEVSKEKKAALRDRQEPKNVLRAKDGKIYKTNFICKLLALILNKAASLDPEGIGVEMEADKPGWCDSLNGLPALLGSSVCEAFELKRAVLVLAGAVKKIKEKGIKSINAAQEVAEFAEGLNSLLESFLSSKDKERDYAWWEKANLLKESFRKKTFFSVEGREKEISLDFLEEFLKSLGDKLDIGIDKARDKKSGLYRAYFTYEAKEHKIENDKVTPLKFKAKPVALFLEGAVHALRLLGKKSLHASLKKSELFDEKLKMYKLNAPLEKESLEIGRSRVFVPGWLENESIWLHMEYKYLLELLKNGFYEEFFEDFGNCGVCFFKPEKYGRSVLENSSFIVSSVYPDKSLWGKGFVARLSGATAEMLNIWILLCLGKEPFFMDKDKQLCLRFAPILTKEFFTRAKEKVVFKGEEVILPKDTFSFKLFSKTLVVYHNPKRKDTFSGDCRVERIEITKKSGRNSIFSSIIKPSLSLDIREKRIKRIDIYLQ